MLQIKNTLGGGSLNIGNGKVCMLSPTTENIKKNLFVTQTDNQTLYDSGCEVTMSGIGSITNNAILHLGDNAFLKIESTKAQAFRINEDGTITLGTVLNHGTSNINNLELDTFIVSDDHYGCVGCGSSIIYFVVDKSTLEITICSASLAGSKYYAVHARFSDSGRYVIVASYANLYVYELDRDAKTITQVLSSSIDTSMSTSTPISNTKYDSNTYLHMYSDGSGKRWIFIASRFDEETLTITFGTKVSVAIKSGYGEGTGIFVPQVGCGYAFAFLNCNTSFRKLVCDENLTITVSTTGLSIGSAVGDYDSYKEMYIYNDKLFIVFSKYDFGSNSRYYPKVSFAAIPFDITNGNLGTSQITGTLISSKGDSSSYPVSFCHVKNDKFVVSMYNSIYYLYLYNGVVKSLKGMDIRGVSLEDTGELSDIKVLAL